MVNLAKKSFPDCPPIASSILAPIEVPHLNSCLLKTNSFFCSDKYLKTFIIRTEKRNFLFEQRYHFS